MDNIKRLASCVNNKEVYLTVLKAHALAGHLSYLRGLEENLRDFAADEDDAEGEEDPPTGEKYDKLVTLQAIFAGKSTRQRIQVQDYHM